MDKNQIEALKALVIAAAQKPSIAMLRQLGDMKVNFKKGGIVGSAQTTDEFIINKKDLYQPEKGGYVGTPQDGLYKIIDTNK